MGVVPPTPVDSDALPAEVDVVVIGGGVIGTSTALSLAEMGLRVALCEKGRIAGEQSGRNWGWVRQMGRSVEELPLAVESLRIWGALNDRVGGETGFRRTGIVYYAETERLEKEHQEWLDHAREFQLPSRMLSAREMQDLLPGMAKPPRAGLYTASDGRAEPHLAAPAIAIGARNAGAQVLTNCAVRAIETSAGAVSAVVTEKGVIKCGAAVLCGGVWSRLFAGNLGLDLPQLKILGNAARLEGVTLPELPVGAEDFAFRKRVDGGYTIARRNINHYPLTPDSFRLLPEYLPTIRKSWHEFTLTLNGRFIAEMLTPRRWRADEVTPFEKARVLDPKPNEKLSMKGLRNILRNYPGMGEGRITHYWAGLIDVTPDAVPVISDVPGIPGFYFGTGLSGHGFGIGPGAGRLMAEIVAGRATCVDPTPFRYSRFQKGAGATRALGAELQESN